MLKSSKGLKRATVISIPNPIDPESLEKAIDKLAFKEIGDTFEESWGFVPPSDIGNWPRMPRVKSAHLMTLRHDRRVLNKSRLSREWHQSIKKKEKDEARKLTKVERDALRDETKAKLFKITAPNEHHSQAIYDHDRRLLIILESSSSIVDFFVDKFNRALQPMNQSIAFKASAQPDLLEDTLTAWAFRPELALEHKFEVRETFRLENSTCKAVLTNQKCNSEEVRTHLLNQKTVQQVALTWDEKVDLMISAKRVLSQMNFKSYVSENIKKAQEETHEDIRAYQEATFMIFLSAFFELWDAVDAIPIEV